MWLVNPKAMSSATPIGSGGDAPVYAVLGGGAAGSAAIWTLRRDGFKGKVVLVEREPDATYDRTALTKFVPSGKMDIKDVPRILKEDILQHVDRVQCEVKRLDTREQRLHFADGESLFYDKLLITSGGAPQRPDLPGSDLAGVHLLRSLQQADDLLKEVDKSQQLVIIGNSFICMEMASALRNRDVEVTVVARHPLPFAQQFGEQIGTISVTCIAATAFSLSMAIPPGWKGSITLPRCVCRTASASRLMWCCWQPVLSLPPGLFTICRCAKMAVCLPTASCASRRTSGWRAILPAI